MQYSVPKSRNDMSARYEVIPKKRGLKASETHREDPSENSYINMFADDVRIYRRISRK